MLFQSPVFFAFFGVLYVLYWNVRDAYHRRWILIAASLFFYGWWDWRFLLHFLAIIAVNYVLYRLLRESRSRRRHWLTLIIALNLANLAFFKYAYAVLEILGESLGLPFLRELQATTHIVLPLAVSFYTFQILAFAIDEYRGEMNARVPAENYALFILFFPQLIAGPIMRHGDFFHQIDRVSFDERRMCAGLFLVLFGLLKKVWLADGIAQVIDPVYGSPSAFSAEANVVAAVGFALQLYLDFSGYTDMARGIAKMLGYELPANFRGPYFSASFSEHWRRWHITLSTWLRDYLYIPLGGNRLSPAKTYRNLFLVMSLGGLWHGHDFTFLIWGMLEGTFLILERGLAALRRRRQATGADETFGSNHAGRVYFSAVKVLAVLIVFSGSVFARIFFRADSLSEALAVIAGIFGGGATAEPEGLGSVYRLFLWAVVFHALEYYQHVSGGAFGTWVLKRRYYLLPPAAVLTMLLLAAIQHPGFLFIYFQF